MTYQEKYEFVKRSAERIAYVEENEVVFEEANGIKQRVKTLLLTFKRLDNQLEFPITPLFIYAILVFENGEVEMGTLLGEMNYSDALICDFKHKLIEFHKKRFFRPANFENYIATRWNFKNIESMPWLFEKITINSRTEQILKENPNYTMILSYDVNDIEEVATAIRQNTMGRSHNSFF